MRDPSTKARTPPDKRMTPTAGGSFSLLSVWTPILVSAILTLWFSWRGMGMTKELAQLESTKPSPALNATIADAVIFAERIMQRIDSQWPTR